MKRILTLCISIIAVLNGTGVFAGTVIIKVERSSFGIKTVSTWTGDTIQWLRISGNHRLRSKNVPAGINKWGGRLNNSSPSFSLVAKVPGVYNYCCTLHGLPVKGQIFVADAPTSEMPIPDEKVAADTSGIKIYPQPFSNNLTVDISNNSLFKGNITVQVFDALGSLKFSKSGEDILQEPLTMDLSALPPGFYLIGISDGANKKAFRVLKAR